MTATRAPGVRVTERPSGSHALPGAGTSTAAFIGTSLYGPTTPTLVRSWTEYLTLYGTRGSTAESVAGNGTEGTATVGASLDGSILNSPRELAVGPDGQLYIAQFNTSQGLLVADLSTRKITRCVTLAKGWGVAVHSDGSALLSLPERHCVYSIPAHGDPIIVAGQDGQSGSTGDRGPATHAKLNSPSGVAWQDDGSWLIASTYEHRIRRVDAGGIITTVAGNGTAGSAGDGGPATSAQLHSPYGMAAGRGRGFYIANYGSNRVRYVDPDGIITTVAGNGHNDATGDGGPPRDAAVEPLHVCADSDGSLYTSAPRYKSVRVVAGGIISSVRLTGAGGARLTLKEPRGLALGPDGGLYIADGEGHRVWVARTRGLLAQAVYGFFANGGSRCYVTRLDLFHPADQALDRALQQLTTVPEVSIVAAPDVWTLHPPTTDTAPTEKYKDGNLALQKIAQHCATNGTRVAIADPPPALTPDQAKTWRDTLTLTGQARQHTAVYYPWVTTSALTPTPVAVPPCGHIAGIWARTDSTRGIHKAPANEAVHTITAPERLLSDTDQGPLNHAGVNCLRVFPGEGTLVWGARTLSDTDDWRYLNVRRYISFVRDTLQQGTHWAVFEPNDQRLWAALRRTITTFLTDQWRAGALQGTTSDQAFYIICDDTVNTPHTITAGRVRATIGLAVTRPAEFIEFTLTQTYPTP